MRRPSKALGRPRLDRARWMAAALLVLAALLARVGLVDRHGLWADEFFSLAMATGHSLEHPADRAEPARGDYVESPGPAPPAAYAAYLEHKDTPDGIAGVTRAVLLSDTSPPLYYWALWAWTRAFGTGDASLRLLSVAWWLACVPPLTSIARRLGGPRAVLPSLLLFCASPQSLFYSTEGRMYSMLWFLTLATARLSMSLRERGPSAWRLWAWAAASSAGLMTHYFFAFAWSGCLAWLLAYPGRTRRAWALGASALAWAAVAPWYAHLGESLGAWRVTRDWLRVVPDGYNLPLSAARLALSYVAEGSGTRWAALTGLVLAALVAAATREIGLRWFTARRRLLWAWLLASLLGPVAFDLLRGTYTVAVPRYAIAGMPAAHLLLAIGWARLGPAARLGFGAVLLLCWAPGTRAIFRDPRAGEPYRRIGRLLAGQAGPADLVIVHSIPSGVAGIARYLAGGDARGSAPEVASWVGQLGRRRMPGDLESLLSGRARARLVLIHAVSEPAPEEEWLRSNATLLGEQHLGTGTILDFAPKDSARFGEAAPSGPRSEVDR